MRSTLFRGVLLGWVVALATGAAVPVAAEGDLRYPRTVALDRAGHLFITDTDHHRIQRVDAGSGAVTTVAGTGRCGGSGDGGPATAAMLCQPHGIAVDAAGNLYVADSPNHRIRRIDTRGVITTVAGTGTAGYSGDGGPAAAARLNRPRNLDIAADGDLVIADTDNRRVRRVDSATGFVTTVAGTGVRRSSGDGGPATAASFVDPRDVALDRAGNLYVIDTEAAVVRRIDGHGRITTVAGSGRSGLAGDGGPALSARLREPRGVAVDSGGTIWIADSGNDRVRRVDPGGFIHTAADSLADPRGLNVGPADSVYVADTGRHRVGRL
jgi:sugar lactone lactonase YvrE